MLTLQLLKISVIFIYLIPLICSAPSTGNVTSKPKFDFRDVVEENSHFNPYPEMCALRIYGGKTVDVSTIPYQVVIRKSARGGFKWSITCGGSIITKLYVLTAAHCFSRSAIRQLRYYRVIAGTSNSNYYSTLGKINRLELEDKIDKTEIWRKIVSVYTHSYYRKKIHNHDMAVLELVFPVTFSSTVQPIPMFKDTYGIKLEADSLALVSGFGIMDYGIPSSYLRMVCIPLVTVPACKRYYGRFLITNTQVCAGDWGRDSCQGDSGGPLVYRGYLLGIVSFGGKCGMGPGVYTLVSSYTTGAYIPFYRSHCDISALNTLQIVTVVILLYIYTLFVTDT